MLRSWLLHFMFPILLIAQLCSSQSINLQNIETFYPGSVPPPVPISPISPSPALSQSPPPTDTPTLTSPTSSKSDVAKAVAATAASTLVFAVIFFFAVQRYCLSKRLKQRQSVEPNPYADPPMPLMMRREFGRVDGGVKGLIVDENGLDVLYWRKLEERNGDGQKNGYVKEVLQKKQSHGEGDTRRDRSKRREPIQEVPLLREKSSASYDFKRVQPEIQDKYQIQSVSVAPARPTSVPTAEMELKAVGKQVSPPLPLPPGAVTAPRPPPPPVNKTPAPPPPPPANKASAPPPPPPIPGNKKGPAPPPPPPRKATGSKPPPGPPSKEEEVNDQVKLKPLHWDKVNTNTEHSMVWNKLDKGSFKFDGDLMEALFGSVAANRGSPQNTSNKQAKAAPSSSQVTILDPRKSQNIAIVLKPLGISRSTLINSLKQGQGLDVETIERLTRIAPTQEEESMILSFAGDPARLADGESFLYHVLKSVPSAFSRLNAMHFRSQYASEMAHLKESLQTLELGCNELRTRGLFMKLLEAILKAGNRMNAGTARGNAQAFHLTALRKLSDVKSTDGKTTLLHFVVEEVVRAEGKRCILNRNRSLNRNNSLSSSETSKEEKEKQYTMLGLPVVGGLSSEFTNVKKSAGIDSDNFAGTCSVLSTRVSEFQRLVPYWDTDGVGGGFVNVMKTFLDDAEEELKVVGGEQRRVMELVKRTTEYYQAGASKDRGAVPLQLFIIVKDFLSMVDQVCVEIARNSQKKKPVTASSVSSSANSPATRTTVKFPILPKHFMSEKSYSSSSDSDNE